MARLPIPGQDAGQWGDLLNDFLSTVHEPDGTLKDNVVTAAALQPGSIVHDALDVAVPPTAQQILSYDGTSLVWIDQLVTSVAGKVGDVVLAKSDVGLASVDNTSDLNKPISTATQNALNSKVDVATVDAKGDLIVGTGNDAIARQAIGSNGQVLVVDSSQPTGVKWTTIALPLKKSTVYPLYPFHAATNSANLTLPEATEYAVPFLAPAGTISAVRTQIYSAGSAGSVMRFGIRANDGVPTGGGNYPGTLLVETTLDTTTTGNNKTANLPTSLVLTDTTVLWVTVTNQGAPTTRAVMDGFVGGNFGGFQMLNPFSFGTGWAGRSTYVGASGVTGALPTTFSTSVNLQNTNPTVGLMFSA